ncbi:MAG TPA: Holliday junction resolvase RuvX [Sandaracinaceae bacterium]
MRTLGIDHGERRVGLALSDEDGRIAHPHATLERRDPRALVSEVAAIVRERGVESIVVGLPLSLDGREGASARRARRFAERLGEETGVPVVLWDERMSTLAAERALGEAGVRKKAQRAVVDRVAAALVLQSYLDAVNERRERSEAWGAGEAPPEADGAAARDARRSRAR